MSLQGSIVLVSWIGACTAPGSGQVLSWPYDKCYVGSYQEWQSFTAETYLPKLTGSRGT